MDGKTLIAATNLVALVGVLAVSVSFAVGAMHRARERPLLVRGLIGVGVFVFSILALFGAMALV